jgi:glucose-6-phosphate-specific signal transduction histidine kinase
MGPAGERGRRERARTLWGCAGTGTSTGPRLAGPGLGLIGMRERVTALGGRLHAGPRDGGGFQVRAEFPTQAPF